MTPERYARICDLFDQALALEAAQRTPFLQEVCADDAALATEVEKMLAASSDTALPPLLPVDISGLLDSAAPVMGRRIGPYEIEQVIGSGGMGSVYLARRLDFHQRVAIKLIKAGHDTAEIVQRFHSERQLLAGLAHPHIARLLDGGTTDEGLPYFVMEYVDGQPIERFCEQQHLSTAQRVELLRQACAAVEHAHREGIIHRDLKPANVLVSADGTPKVLDFGLAKRLAVDPGNTVEQSPTQSGAILGTPSYMAPEQASGRAKQVGPAADVYALGAILYELLTGRPPFRGETSLDTLLQVLHHEPVSPGQLHPKLSRDLETICLKCLQKEPSRRYASAAALADDLARWQRGEPIAARPVGRLEKAWRWAKRQPALATTATLSVLGLLAVTVVSIVFAVNKAQDADEIRQAQTRTEGALVQTQLAEKNTKSALAESEQIRRQLLGEKTRTQQALHAARLQASRRTLDQAVVVCEKGEVSKGLLLLARALELAPEDTTTLQTLIRRQLAAWSVLQHRLQFVLPHDGSLRPVVYSPDGKYLATGSATGRVYLWQATTGALLASWSQHSDVVLDLAFHNDSLLLASASKDGTAQMWSTKTLQAHGPVLRHPGPVRCLAFSPDGVWLATGSYDGKVRFWDTSNGDARGDAFRHTAPVRTLAFGGDGTWLATGTAGGKVFLWHVGNCLHTDQPMSHASDVTTVAFSRDGKQLASASEDGTARLWSVPDGKSLGGPLRHDETVFPLQFHPDGKKLLTAGGEKKARLWNLDTDRLVFDPLLHRGPILGAVFDPLGQRILTVSRDATACIWDTANGQRIGTPLLHPQSLFAAAWRPDGQAFATTGDDTTMRVWQPVEGPACGAPLVHPAGVQPMAWSGSGRLLAAGCQDGQVLLWEVSADGRKRSAVPLSGHNTSLWCLRFSPDDRWLVSGGADWVARLWDVAGRKLVFELPHQDKVWAVAFSPDSQFVATGSSDKSVRLWRVKDGQPVGEPLPHGYAVLAVVFHPDGKRLLTACADDKARLWEAATGQLLQTFPHQSRVQCLALHPDHNRLLTGSSDNTACLWDLTTGKLLATLPHQALVWRVAFSGDGRLALTASHDGTARLWDAATGKPVGLPLDHGGQVMAAAFSLDGQLVLTVGDNGMARLWDTATSQPVGPPLQHHGDIFDAVFVPGGKLLATSSPDRTVRLWHLPGVVDGSPERVRQGVERMTGMRLGEDEAFEMLDAAVWQKVPH